MQATPSNLICYTVRLKPGEELMSSLLQFVKDNELKSAFVMTCVGSLTKATLRMANAGDGGKNAVKTFEQCFEILSLVGTLSGGEGHLHMTLGDKEGQTIGGHVMGDCFVFTTAEVVIGECPKVAYTREMDDSTGYPELAVCSR